MVATEVWKSRCSVSSATLTMVMSRVTMIAPSMIVRASLTSSAGSLSGAAEGVAVVISSCYAELAVAVKTSDGALLTVSAGWLATVPAMEASYDLRERKRTRTRLMIQAEAMRLFAENGYENTTVEQIAYAAAISPRTFFRYFPTKEDVVLWDEYDPIAVDLFEARPEGESPADTLRAIIREAVAGLYRRDPEQLLVRARLLGSVPELRARMLEQQDSGNELLASLLARRHGRPVDDLGIRVLASAFGAAITIAVDAWQKEGGESDLLELVERAIDALATGLRELEAEAP
jgi:AcrR family transcriptional regulator